MAGAIRILLQTTIPETDDDWDIRRFSLLTECLRSLKDENGAPLCEVTARNRAAAGGDDPVLSGLGESDFDELWLFAVDVGDGLSAADCAGINGFHRRGGGLMVTRDHMDLGCSVCSLGAVGAAHNFHTHNPEHDPERQCIDDIYTTDISWPNYHSGRNGDYQKIVPVEPMHELLCRPDAPGDPIEYLPAHPHEGAVGIPEVDGIDARVVARGASLVSGRLFNLAVAIERTAHSGRAVAESTFHHFSDVNWDGRYPCPSFVCELPGDTMQTHPRALEDTKAYVRNLALWLAPEGVSCQSFQSLEERSAV
ncbi:hypothetical protein [Gloeobacter violaceus]|uniref:Glr0395 protein n=1 Tax=Gloeobacter violaceus (strain ATCC 29082 / PCC 7421) TaxID=251221 RepID=Q7NNL6_GLOVI|nr:glr0395 [Gloeobacter violaceus PCC 7421]